MNKKNIGLTEQQATILDSMVRDMGHYGNWCFYVVSDQDTSVYGGYIPAMVFRDVQSYFSMNGPAYGDIPFIIGQELDEAVQRCRLMNEHIGLDKQMVEDILESAGLENN